MTRIEAIIKQHKLEDVKDHLGKSGVHALTILDATDFKRNRESKSGTYRGASVGQDTVRRLVVFFYVEDALAEEAIETLLGAAVTGEGSDGHIAVTCLSDLIRISDGVRGEKAIG
ncbi:MAG: P-II family nitrogen regulator [Thermodesulfobacteriota bacterium]